ncbi:hypothetical protein N0V83_009167 [Neocucurbitaria cava]|uniref:Uncharacterized protein n=1 Tax=Neocucurbitaria cava TaxID=798079 RepID=A0A9W8Y226_9PLEO|nr:hypothetical protein N0V83_009167 [Neocucurbitaria cava]
MAAELIEAVASAIFRAIGLGIHVSGENSEFNTLRYENTNDIITKTTYDNTCVFYMTGKPGTVDNSVVSVDTWLRCGDDVKLTGAYISPGLDNPLSFFDDRVGTITVSWQEDSTSQFPFPGLPIVSNDLWHSKGWGDSIPFENCIQLSETGQIESKDCKGMYCVPVFPDNLKRCAFADRVRATGKSTEANICTSGFTDGYEGVINRDNIVNHGWAYFMAFPVNGGEAACPSSKRSLSRFNIEDVD